MGASRRSRGKHHAKSSTPFLRDSPCDIASFCVEPRRCSCLLFWPSRSSARNSSSHSRNVRVCRLASRMDAGSPGTHRPGGRGRQAGPPAGPVPRNADGRAIFATPGKKGVWLPGGGGGATTNRRRSIPLQPWAALSRRPQRKSARAAHALQAVRRRASVPDAIRCRDRRAARAPAHLHLRHRRAAHLSNRSTWMAGRIRRMLTPSFYGHSIGWWEGDTLNVETTGVQRGLLDRSPRPAHDRKAPDARKVHAHRLADGRVRTDD